MKLILRFIMFCASVAAFGFAFLGSTHPVLAGCTAQFDIDSVIAYRDHIIINFTYNMAASSPIEFSVVDNAAPAGSGTFSSATPGSFSIEFDLDSSIVQELDKLDIEGSPNLGCNA